jgi:hypothetical protein
VPERGEERRILELVAAGQLSADEAAELLDALKDADARALTAPPVPPVPAVPTAPQPPPAQRGIARQLRILVEADGDAGDRHTSVAINVPLGLAKFAARLLPDEAKAQLERRGVNLDDLLAALDADLPEGRLVDIDATEESGDQHARIVIEVI